MLNLIKIKVTTTRIIWSYNKIAKKIIARVRGSEGGNPFRYVQLERSLNTFGR